MELLETSRAGLVGPLEAKVLALLDEAFPDGVSATGDYYAQNGTPEIIVILQDGQELVGHLALYRRHVGIGHESVEIGLIGGIAIARDRRGRGHSRRLLQHAHGRLKERSIPFSILFAYEPRIYQRSGYRLMQNATHFLDADGTWKTLVYRGGMYAELMGRSWPNQIVDLRGPVV
jgi:predicted acetyltransferase